MLGVFRVGLGLATAALLTACGTGDGTPRGGGLSGGGGEGNSAGTLGAGGATGGTWGAGGSPGVGGVGVGGTSGMSGSGGACASTEKTAETKKTPTDIIITVDQSGSMGQETKWVQDQLNAFSQSIVASGIDFLVVLIVEAPGGPVGEHPICVPPPLAGPNCGDNIDPSTGSGYKQVNQHVDNHDGWQKVLSMYPQYSSVLRRNANKHIISISDDHSNMTWVDFKAQLLALDPPMFEGFKQHAIVCASGSGLRCQAAGNQYVAGVNDTGGVFGELKNQDFQPVWDAVSQQVKDTTTIECEWDIGTPPMGEVLDKDKINVKYTANGMTSELGRVNTPADCSSAPEAYHYDDPNNPTKVVACPQLCTKIQADAAMMVTDQKIELAFGCESKIAVPK